MADLTIGGQKYQLGSQEATQALFRESQRLGVEPPKAMSVEMMINPQKPIQLPTPPQDTTNYSGIVAANNLFQPTQIPDYLKSFLEGSKAPANPMDSYQQLEKDLGVNEKREELNRLSQQLNLLNSELETGMIELEGAGISKSEALLKQRAIARTTALKALPLQAQLSAAQGNLELAENRLNTYFKIQSDYEDRLYSYNKELRQVVYEWADKDQQRKIDALNKEDDRKFDLMKINLNYAQDIASTAIANGAGGIASQIMSLDPKSATYQQDVAKLATRIPRKPYASELTGGGGSNPLSILDVGRYNELYPDAGIVPGDTELTAQQKVNALFSPRDYEENELRQLAQSNKDSNTPYEEVIQGIEQDATIANKDRARAIIDEVYGRNKEKFVKRATKAIQNTLLEDTPVGRTIDSIYNFLFR